MATAKEIVQKGMVAVRNSATLYPAYQELFKEAFGYYPECPTCGSLLGQNQWKAFEAFVAGADPKTLLTSKTETMSKNTFIIKDKSKLYAYNFKKKGQDRDFTSRTYGDVMTEDFAVGYLDSAKDDADLLAERKSYFSKLPAKFSDMPTDQDTSKDPADLSKMKMVELQEVAISKGYSEDDWKSIKSKADMIAYLEAKALAPDLSKVNDQDQDQDDDSLI